MVLLEGVALLKEVYPCWRQCVTVRVGFESPMLKLHPVTETSCYLWIKM